MKKSINCAHIVLACLMLCLNVASAAPVGAVSVVPVKSTDIKTIDTSDLHEVKVHAEPQLDVVGLKKLGAGLPDIAVTSLYEMGFIQGSVFEGASSEHEFTVFYPLPVDYYGQIWRDQTAL